MARETDCEDAEVAREGGSKAGAARRGRTKRERERERERERRKEWWVKNTTNC
jgi:hypothetical protein